MSNVSVPESELATCNDGIDATDEPSMAERELGALADKLAQARMQVVASYEQAGLSRQEALAKLKESPASFVDHLRKQPLKSTTFWQLDEIAASDPQAAMKRWHSMIDEAGDQIATGHSAADALEVSPQDAWQRAQFMALCDELADGWQPRNGIERQIIHSMVQSLTMKNFWLHKMLAMEAIETSDCKEHTLAPPRVSTLQAIDQAATMVERFDRMFIRALRQLRDLRRYMPTIVVNNAGQVNIGEQQVNVKTKID